MKKIVIKLEYKCYPMWFCDDGFLENDLIKELNDDKIIDEKLINIQNIYDALFIDDGIEFSYKGFKNSQEKMNFKKQVDDAVRYIRNKIGDKYAIENAINYEEI